MTGIAFALGALVIIAWAALHEGIEEKLIKHIERKNNR